MIEKLKKIYTRAKFQPTFFALFFNPFYFARKGLFEHNLALAPLISGKILDVGCGCKPYEELFNASSYMGLEIDSEINRNNCKVDCFYDGREFPFIDASFDGIVVNQVLEHVFTPEIFLSEIRRVLKDGGMLLMTVPFAWDEHEQPFDFARYTSFALRDLFQMHGFEVVEQRKSMNDIRAVVQLLNLYFYKKTLTANKYINLLMVILLITPWNLLGELMAMLLPKNDDFYLDNVIIARKIS